MKANKFFAIALAALTLMACNKKDEPQAELKITPAQAEVSVGATVQLSANMEVTWSSSDAAIAGVNDKGLVTGIKEGEATITAKAVKSNGMATCKITVKAGGVTPPPAGDIPEIDVTDGSLADWEALPKDKVVSFACPEEASLLGLKGVAVYATEMYINILVEPDMETITDLSWVPFHVYLDADNSDATGGYGNEFSDANCDILCETAIFGEGEPIAYNPGVFKWWGEVGYDGEDAWDYWTEPGVEHDASDHWGAIIGEGQLPVGNSQYVDGKFEIQLLRELLATVAPMSDEAFGIGFDIQQSWSSVGILPCVAATDENPTGKTAKLKVKINK